MASSLLSRERCKSCSDGKELAPARVIVDGILAHNAHAFLTGIWSGE